MHNFMGAGTRRWFVRMALFLLVVLCGSANAATSARWYQVAAGVPGDNTSSMQSACESWLGRNPGYTFSAIRAPSPPYFICDVTANAGGAIRSLEGGTGTRDCPTGQDVTLPSSAYPQCAVPPVNNCPEAGTSAGIRNITTAWANGPGVGANIQQKILPDGALGNPGSVSYCVSSCGIANSGSGVTGCWQSTVASDTGLHRISCDVPMNHTGQPCTAGTGAGQTPDPTVAPPAPACAGAFGTVNGKPTCLDSSGSTPNNTTPAPLPGNPAPGTVGGGDKSTGVDTGTGAGTGTDGTGTGGAGGGGTGGGGSVTIDLKDLATCGLPGKPKCQMDESGTPTGSDTKITDEQVKVVTDGRISEMGKKQDSWGLSWNFQLPQGACQPLDMSFKGVGGSFDWCPYLQKLRSIIGYFYVMLTLLGIYMSYSNAVKFNKS